VCIGLRADLIVNLICDKSQNWPQSLFFDQNSRWGVAYLQLAYFAFSGLRLNTFLECLNCFKKDLILFPAFVPRYMSPWYGHRKCPSLNESLIWSQKMSLVTLVPDMVTKKSLLTRVSDMVREYVPLYMSP